MNAGPTHRLNRAAAEWEISAEEIGFDPAECLVRGIHPASLGGSRRRPTLLPSLCEATGCGRATGQGFNPGGTCPLATAARRSQSKRSLRGGMEFHRLRRVLRYIEEHLGEDIPRETMAEVACLSRQQFASSFNVTMGIAPHRYLIQRRIRRSQHLLVATDDTITTIAFALGFCSHGHFATQFKQLTGMTPSRFRAIGRRQFGAH